MPRSPGPGSSRTPIVAATLPPPAVAKALARVAELVNRNAAGWTVGGVLADAGVDSLGDALYAHWYTMPATPPAPAESDPPLFRRTLLSALRAADARATTTARGWTVTGSDPTGKVSAVRDEVVRILRPGEYVMPVRPGVPPAPGEPIEPVARLDQVDDERGIWWTFSSQAPERPIGRVYVNVRSATAARAIHEVTSGLDAFPYQVKCPIVATACERVDAVVLYHGRSARHDVLDALLARWSGLGPLLDPAVPPLTCPVRPGLAWADDVEDGHSYGESRCLALAAAIDKATSTWSGLVLEERIALLVEGLRAAGVDPQRPWRAVT
jgi:HopA1 effector protein family